MNTLHRGDDAQLAEARDIGSINMLRVLDPPTQLARIGAAREGALENIEHFAIGAISDSVNTKLESVLQREVGGLADVRGVLRVEAAWIHCIGRQIGVGLQ